MIVFCEDFIEKVLIFILFYTIAPNLTIYCENQAVADLFKDGTNYKSSTTKIVVDATKFA